MEIKTIKYSEKVLIWMKRKNITQIEAADELGITRQTFAKRLKEDDFTVFDKAKLRELGIE